MPPSEHELRLRERLGRLRNLSLLGGAAQKSCSPAAGRRRRPRASRAGLRSTRTQRTGGEADGGKRCASSERTRLQPHAIRARRPFRQGSVHRHDRDVDTAAAAGARDQPVVVRDGETRVAVDGFQDLLRPRPDEGREYGCFVSALTPHLGRGRSVPRLHSRRWVRGRAARGLPRSVGSSFRDGRPPGTLLP